MIHTCIYVYIQEYTQFCLYNVGSTPRLGGHTPGLDMMTSSMTPGQTPLRDQLSINESSSDGGFDDSYSQQV